MPENVVRVRGSSTVCWAPWVQNNGALRYGGLLVTSADSVWLAGSPGEQCPVAAAHSPSIWRLGRPLEMLCLGERKWKNLLQ